MPEEPTAGTTPPLAQPTAQPAQTGQQQQFPTDYSGLSTVYTNFCRVSVTPEELALDFGLNTQMSPNPEEPIRLTHRVVMNFYTAKRLMNALLGVISQHENAYGVLELDFQRRARAGAAARPATAGAQPRPPAPPAPPSGK